MSDQKHDTGRAIFISQADNVATIVHTAPGLTGYRIMNKTGQGAREIQTAGPVEVGHKIALVPIPASGGIVKYGEVIGRATKNICTGDHVHVHNMESCRGKGK